MKITQVTITVKSLKKAIKFYVNRLHFRVDHQYKVKTNALSELYQDKRSKSIKVADLSLGNEKIRLIEFRKREGWIYPADSQSNDLWFQHLAIVTNDMTKAYENLSSQRLRHISSFPQTLPEYLPNAAGISAFYFTDPDKHPLELIEFPADKMAEKWTSRKSKYTLQGIDHTAIAVKNTARSLNFYHSILGFKKNGESENYGHEQEHLTGVFNARMKITNLQGKDGPGLEILEYITPRDGRRYPIDTDIHDMWVYQTGIKVKDIEGVFKKIQSLNLLFSNAIVDLSKIKEWQIQKGFLARDPDGHFLFIHN